MDYSFRLAARVILYAPSHRQYSIYHDVCYTIVFEAVCCCCLNVTDTLFVFLSTNVRCECAIFRVHKLLYYHIICCFIAAGL